MSGRILIVDDQKGICRLLETVFSSDGWQVHSVGDGLQAVEAATAFAPDIIIMDYRMPYMDGVEAARRISEFSAIPIILMTAYGEDEAARLSAEAGIERCITKPFDLAHLRAVVAEYRGAGSEA